MRFTEPSKTALRAALLFAVVLSPSAVGADGPQPLVITVSPTRHPTPIEQVGSTVTVVTAADIERAQQRTVPDVLRAIPGVVVVQAGGPGAATTVSLRGTNTNHTKALIDGVDAGDPSSANGAFDFGNLLTSDIERVEVLRGPQSGLYGSDAIGGVINIVTRKGSGPARASASLEGGSFSTFNQTAGVSGSADRFDYAFNIAHLHAGDTPVTPTSLLPAGRARIGDRADNLTASTRLGAKLSDDFSLGLVARYADARLRFTGDDFSTFPATPAAMQSRSENRLLVSRLEARHVSFEGAFEQRAGIAYTEHRREIVGPDPVLTPKTAYSGDRVKFDWLGVLALGSGQTVTGGLEHATDSLDDSTLTAENKTSAGHLQLDSRFGERLFNSLSVRHDDNDRFGGVTTWRMAPSVLIGETATRLKASYGTGFKAPSLSQLFVSYPAFNFFANPALKPERSKGYDAGVEQSLLDGRLRFGATYFHNDITDLITTNAGFTSLENRPSATTDGVESFVALAVTPWLTLRGDHTYTEARDNETGGALLRRPKHKASAAAIWQVDDDTALTVSALHVGARVDGNRDFSVQRLNAPSYTLVNVAGSYRVTERATAFARIENLFDRRYEDPTGFERPGLGVFFGVRVEIDAGR